MKRPGVLRRLTHAAALLAVALLAFAGARSVVMQAEANTVFGSAPICAAGPAGSNPDPRQAVQAACAFCAAAAEVPLQGLVQPLRTPSWTRWTPSPSAPPGAAPPPAPPMPRARGPPVLHA